MRVELNANRGGLGDLVTASYLAEGMKAVGRPVAFYIKANSNNPDESERPNAVKLLQALGQRVCVGSRGVQLGNHFPGYHYELRADGISIARGEGSRIESWRKVFPFDFEPTAPTVTHQDEAEVWAKREFAGDNIVGLFPEASFNIRNWPLNKWIRLQRALRDEGFDVRVFLAFPEEHKRYEGAPWKKLDARYHRMPMPRLLAALARCRAVVSPDSGGAHMAGVLGRKTLVLCGPSRGMYQHYGRCISEVRVSKEVMPCVGCHFRAPGISVACNAGCEALQTLSTDRVLEEVRLVAA